MHATENLRQKFAFLRMFLEFREAPLHAVQTLLAFNEKFARQLVHLTLIGRMEGNLRTACSISAQREML
jgi:hypothetical protein